MPQWQVQLLGGFQIRSGDQVVRQFRTRAVDALFAYLALHIGRELRRDELIEIGWPGTEPTRGSQSLRTALHNIRSILGHETLSASRDAVSLVPECFEVDAVRFRFTRDLSLYQGRLLNGLAADWIWAIAQDLEELYVQTLIEAMEGAKPEIAAQLGSAALRLDPTLVAVRSKMRELSLAGDSCAPLAAPYILTSFVGRESELAQLDELLATNRLVTLTGLGGSGKSRLASELWRRRQPNSWFVPLVDVSNPQRIGDTIRQRLRLPASQGRSGLEQVIANLREETGLLVLDNFEQILEGASIVEELLDHCPGIQIVVTSRVGLGLGIGTDFPVGSLSVAPQSDGSLSESATLFTARARSALPGFSLAGENSQAITELCQRLDGFPLSLELAAAKSRLFTPQEMLAQLEDRFDFLSRPDRDLEARQASLLNTLDWSFDRLGEREQELLCRLSIFEGGFTLDAAKAVCGASPNGKEIESLLIAAWIERTASSGRSRFRLLESVREYGHALLRPKEEAELRLAHAEYFGQLAARCFDDTYRPAEPQTFQLIREDSANLESAWSRLYELGDERMLVIANGLNWYWRQSGMAAFGERRLRETLARCSDKPTWLLTAATHSCGTLILSQGKYAESIEWYEKTNERARVCEYNLYIGLSLTQIGYANAELGNYAVGLEYATEGLAFLQSEENQNWIAAGYTVIALIANRSGDIAAALEAGERAVEFGRKGGYPWAIASALNELAMACHLNKEYERSIVYQKESIELKIQGQSLPSLALSYADLAATSLAMQDVDQASCAIKEWARTALLVNEMESVPRVFCTAAELFWHRGRDELAAASLAVFVTLSEGRAMNPSEKAAHMQAQEMLGEATKTAQKFTSLEIVEALQAL